MYLSLYVSLSISLPLPLSLLLLKLTSLSNVHVFYQVTNPDQTHKLHLQDNGHGGRGKVTEGWYRVREREGSSPYHIWYNKRHTLLWNILSAALIARARSELYFSSNLEHSELHQPLSPLSRDVTKLTHLYVVGISFVVSPVFHRSYCNHSWHLFSTLEILFFVQLGKFDPNLTPTPPNFLHLGYWT